MVVSTAERAASACPASAAPLPGGGWRITGPLTWVPSSNRTTREHWTARRERVAAITADLVWLLGEYRVPKAHVREARTRIGRLEHVSQEGVVFDRARLALRLYFRRVHRRDPGNWGQGAGAKSLVDAMVSAGWLYDDDAAHLTCDEPVLLIDRARPRVEIDMVPWDGVRA